MVDGQRQDGNRLFAEPSTFTRNKITFVRVVFDVPAGASVGVEFGRPGSPGAVRIALLP